MSRGRKSHIWDIPAEEFALLVQKSSSWKEIVQSLGLTLSGGPYNTVHRRIRQDGLDVQHLCEGVRKIRAQASQSRAPDLESTMVVDSSYSRKSLKTRLLLLGMLQNICAICGGSPLWNDKPLVLVLDHINGNPRDHRKDNLRLVCPNCNSQLDTFAGRNARRSPPKTPKTSCLSCDRPTVNQLCSHCSRRKPLGGVSDESLAKLVWEKPVLQVARELGVSDVAIKKRCKVRGMPTPGRGYWQKKASGKLSISP